MKNMDSQHFVEMINKGESTLVEFKRDWWHLDNGKGKAEFSKDVLAMANSLSEGQSGFFLIGVEDTKAGGNAIGIQVSPPQESVAQILVTYTNPVPNVELYKHEIEGKTIDILEVAWTESHPYYATRDVENFLSSDAVYVRRAGTVGRLKPSEMERLIRAKDARLGKIADTTPLVVGFVELPVLGALSKIVFSIRNVTEEPVSDINVAIDVIRLGKGGSSISRVSQLHSLNLPAQQARESELQLEQQSYLNAADGRYVRFGSSEVREGITLRLIVRYRDRDGFLDEIVKEVSIW
jgi:hypothetical protein